MAGLGSCSHFRAELGLGSWAWGLLWSSPQGSALQLLPVCLRPGVSQIPWTPCALAHPQARMDFGGGCPHEASFLGLVGGGPGAKAPPPHPMAVQGVLTCLSSPFSFLPVPRRRGLKIYGNGKCRLWPTGPSSRPCIWADGEKEYGGLPCQSGWLACDSAARGSRVRRLTF